MKRLLGLVLVALLGVVAWLVPVPAQPPPSEDLPVTTTVATSARSFAECAWASSAEGLDTVIALAALPEVDAKLSFPHAGEVRALHETSVTGAGAVVLPVSRVLDEHTAPVLVEFSDGPAAAGVIVGSGAVLAGDPCTSASTKVWLLPGGSTRQGERLILYLFNPFSEDARVALLVTSEHGIEPGVDDSLSVAASSFTEITFDDQLPLRDSLSVTVEAEEGLVIPAMELRREADLAVWTGVTQSSEWHFPLVQSDALEPSVVLANDGLVAVEYEIEFFTASGASAPPVESGELAATSHVRIPLGDLAAGSVGLRISADAPIAATVVGESESGIAVTAGAPAAATRWLLPGFGAVSGRHSLWLLNTGDEQITVTYQVLDPGGLNRDPAKIAVRPASVRRVLIEAGASAGLVVESTAPFTAAWSVEQDGAVAYSAGVPLEE